MCMVEYICKSVYMSAYALMVGVLYVIVHVSVWMYRKMYLYV